MKHWLYTTAVVLALAAVAVPANAATSGADADCGGAFTKVDTNGDGIISSSEASSAATKEFACIDSDSSGVVSKAEWQNCGLAARLREKNDYSATKNPSGIAPEGMQMAIDVQPWEADEDFTKADADKSGDVSRDEAAKAAESEYSTLGSKMAKEDFARAYGERFAQLDANGDGSLSKDEFNKRDSVRIEASFGHLDGNDNGEFSKSEWQVAHNVNQPSGEPMTIRYYFVY
jgi:hypothetical protein